MLETDDGGDVVERALPEGHELTRYEDGLYRYALKRLGDPDGARDAVQETYVAALEGMDGYDEDVSLRGWLFGILKHKICDSHRLHRRERSTDHPELHLGPHGMVEVAAGDLDVITTGQAPPSPLERSEGVHLAWICRQGLARLPGHLSETFRMSALEGRPSDEVCRSLSISPANLWVRCHRARKILKGWVRDRWPVGNVA